MACTCASTWWRCRSTGRTPGRASPSSPASWSIRRGGARTCRACSTCRAAPAAGPRPLRADGWIGQALKTHRVVLLDQRGTGRSTRVDGRRMGMFDDAAKAADHLARFRADSIVADAEHLRKTVFGGRRWATLGQSYGGFLTMTYLSYAPEGLTECYVTGGLPSLDPDASEVYRRTYPRVEAKNAEFYRRYPHQVELVARIADRLAEGDVLLPDGDVLTVRQLQSLGIDFGMKPGYERMHWLLDEAFTAGELSSTFLYQVLARSSYSDDPLFAALQEAIYGRGSWTAAERERSSTLGSRRPPGRCCSPGR
ncbi:alpha/beta fold hydrolase [Streptosporangium lutulentum]